MKRLILGFLLFGTLISLSGCDNKKSWQNNTRMIADAYLECKEQTIKKFNKESSINTMQFIGYIQQDIKFKKSSKSEDKFMTKCLKNIVDNYTANDWYNKS